MTKKDQLKQLADYIVNDGAYAKQKYVDGILENTELHLICKLRKDADLRYLYTGEHRPGKGVQKKYDGKMNCKQIDKSRFELCCIDENSYVYTAVVNSKFLKRNIRIAYVGIERTIHTQFSFQQIQNLEAILYTVIIKPASRLNFCSGMPSNIQV